MSGIKDCIISRWGNDGLIIDADYSQLEVIGLAHLSGDVQLKNDLLDGLDMHCLNASLLWDIDYETIYDGVQAGDKDMALKRKMAKGPGFLIQYGGGAKTMAKNTGVPYKRCKKFISGYYNRYFQVKRWQTSNLDQVLTSRQRSLHRTQKGLPAGKGELKSITGRIYTFLEEDSISFSGRLETSFSPTKIKNYPVQGFATGDIVPEVIGQLHRLLTINQKMYRHRCLLINTVHDSILFDCRRDVAQQAADLIRCTMEKAPQFLRTRFGIKDFDLPLKVDVQAGTSWGTLKPI